MRSFYLLLLTMALSSAPGLAQNEVYVAYPLDSLDGTFGHWNPLGVFGVNNDECREQMLIRGAYLPPCRCAITAIEVATQVPGTLPYQNLTISMGHSTVNSLSMTFAANLANPVLVYNIQNQSISWTSLHPMAAHHAARRPFRHDGQSNLVIEFQRIIDRPNTPNLLIIAHQYSTCRQDLPCCVWASGAYGSGAAQAGTATCRYNVGPMLHPVDLCRHEFPGDRWIAHLGPALLPPG